MNEEEEEPKLLQLLYLDNPWKLLVVCFLLNRTQRKQAEPVLPWLFAAYPTADEMARAGEQLTRFLRPLGFQNVRAGRLRAFSEEWATHVHRTGALPTEAQLSRMTGIGSYALDAYRLFVLGRRDVKPTDKELRRWATWREMRRDAEG